MDELFRKLAIILLAGLHAACTLSAPPQASVPTPDKATRQIIRERLSAVVVTGRSELGRWVNSEFAISKAPSDADGGSAAPISEDGYFLTADHVLHEAPEKNIFIIYANGGKILTTRARIVWRSSSDDFAILHIPRKTPYYYRWSAPDRKIARGHPIIHGGMATGSDVSLGLLRTELSPEGVLTGSRVFKMNLPLQPGDSGGPVIDGSGNLIGINSAVEFLVPMETAIFIDSEGVRPNTRKIAAILRKDRVFNKTN